MSYFVRLHSWRVDNPELVSFFSENNNKIKFIDTISILNESDKILIRDYFFWILHTGLNDRIEKHSYYVSATTDAEICENYAGEDREGPLAIICLIPNEISRVATSYLTLIEGKDLLIKNSLPSLNSEVYPNESEISFKAGIFPHFILGVYNYITDEIVINHHFFKKQNYSNKKILNRGIRIQQDDFFKYLSKTKYYRGAALHSYGRYSSVY